MGAAENTIKKQQGQTLPEGAIGQSGWSPKRRTNTRHPAEMLLDGEAAPSTKGNRIGESRQFSLPAALFGTS